MKLKDLLRLRGLASKLVNELVVTSILIYYYIPRVKKEIGIDLVMVCFLCLVIMCDYFHVFLLFCLALVVQKKVLLCLFFLSAANKLVFVLSRLETQMSVLLLFNFDLVRRPSHSSHAGNYLRYHLLLISLSFHIDVGKFYVYDIIMI